MVCAGQKGAHPIRCLMPCLQRDVEVGGPDTLEIRQGLRVLHRTFNSVGFEFGQWHDSVAHRRGEVLPEKGTKRHVFPGLDVAGGPVVDEYKSFDVAVGLGHRDGLTAQ